MIRGLRFIRLEVSNLERSLAFYRRGLRFAAGDLTESPDPASTASNTPLPAPSEVVPLEPSVRKALLIAGTLRLVLEEVPAQEENGSRGRGVDLAIEVSGVDVYHDALVERGIEPSRPMDLAGMRVFSVRDPDGYVWRVHQSLD